MAETQKRIRNTNAYTNGEGKLDWLPPGQLDLSDCQEDLSEKDNGHEVPETALGQNLGQTAISGQVIIRQVH